MVERGKTVFDVAVWINLTPLGLKQVAGKGLSELEDVLEEVGLWQSRARPERWSICMVGSMPFCGTASGTEVSSGRTLGPRWQEWSALDAALSMSRP
jgi:hypothetical protein